MRCTRPEELSEYLSLVHALYLYGSEAFEQSLGVAEKREDEHNRIETN